MGYGFEETAPTAEENAELNAEPQNQLREEDMKTEVGRPKPKFDEAQAIVDDIVEIMREKFYSPFIQNKMAKLKGKFPEAEKEFSAVLGNLFS